jgi:hypothetical protein
VLLVEGIIFKIKKTKGTIPPYEIIKDKNKNK